VDGRAPATARWQLPGNEQDGQPILNKQSKKEPAVKQNRKEKISKVLFLTTAVGGAELMLDGGSLPLPSSPTVLTK